MITIEQLRNKIAHMSQDIEQLTQTREDYLATIHNIEMEITRLVGGIKALDSLIKENIDETQGNDQSELCTDAAKTNEQSNSSENSI